MLRSKVRKAQNLYENTHTYRVLLRMIKQDWNKWTHISCCWISKFSTVKISLFPN